jgi:hypothetical protein
MNHKENKTQKTRKPWPTKEAMEQIYAMKLWGDNNTDFYSGQGSHNPTLVNPYIQVVSSFLQSFKTPIAVCDLGCGDFNVGKELVSETKNYIAVDIVPALIAHHKENFQAANLEFHCLDIATDPLPFADCALLRQVLQHLSNAEVKRVLTAVRTYKYLILTEHLPEGEFEPNKDIISGQGIRLKKNSGLEVLAAPFHLKVKKETQLLAIVLEDDKGVLVTSLYELF